MSNVSSLVFNTVYFYIIISIQNSRNFLTNSKIYVAKDKHSEVLALATEIMKTGVKYMDAAHVACSIIAECKYLITTDKRLIKYKPDQVIIVNPVDFIRILEDDDHV